MYMKFILAENCIQSCLAEKPEDVPDYNPTEPSIEMNSGTLRIPFQKFDNLLQRQFYKLCPPILLRDLLHSSKKIKGINCPRTYVSFDTVITKYKIIVNYEKLDSSVVVEVRGHVRLSNMNPGELYKYLDNYKFHHNSLRLENSILDSEEFRIFINPNITNTEIDYRHSSNYQPLAMFLERMPYLDSFAYTVKDEILNLGSTLFHWKQKKSVLSSCPTESDLAEDDSGFRFLKTLWKKVSGSSKKQVTLCCVCYEPQKKNRKFYTCSKIDSVNVHFFCRSCILGFAKSIAESAPLSECGTGFPCMETDCKNVINYKEIRRLIPRQLRKRIDDRILEESVSKAGIKIERCGFCNFPLELPPVEMDKVLDCPECRIKTCRVCRERWDESHFGVPCQELLASCGSAKLQRYIEQKINEKVVRKCHRCNLQFTKTDGCNHMKCRCGAIQCYVCKKPDVRFSHFCKCGPVCDCQKTCKLYEPAKSIHRREIIQVKKSTISIPK